MSYQHKIDPQQGFRERCSALKRLENTLKRSNVLVRINYVDAKKTKCIFETFEGVECNSIEQNEKNRLKDAVALARRSAERFRNELFSDSLSNQDGYIYWNYWPMRRPKRKSRIIEHKKEKSGKKVFKNKNQANRHYLTFDDCSSVWTLPSNWKTKE